MTQKEEIGRKISLRSDIQKVAANVQGKRRRQRERNDNEKRIKREEREKKRKLNEEIKMKRM